MKALNYHGVVCFMVFFILCALGSEKIKIACDQVRRFFFFLLFRVGGIYIVFKIFIPCLVFILVSKANMLCGLNGISLQQV